MSTSILWENLLGKEGEKDILTLLRGVPIFEDLSRRDLRALARILHRRKYSAGEYIFREGDPGLGMYIIESGQVSVVIESQSKELSRLGEGDFFGEMALFTEEPRMASALAYEETKLFGFFQPDLYGLMETHPRVGLNIVMRLARVLSTRLYRAARQNSELSEELSRMERR